MDILYITLSEPRLSESGIYPDLLRALKRASHHITIVYAASPRKQKKTELSEENGVSVLSVVVGENFDVGLIQKGINILKMEPLLKKAIGRYLKGRHFDLCIYATPPVTFAGVVQYSKRLFGAETFLMLKDIFPQNAVDIGLFKEGSLIHRYFKYKEKKLYALSDHIGCMSEGNLKYIREHEPWLEERKLLVFPNTIEVSNLSDSREDADGIEIGTHGSEGKASGDRASVHRSTRFVFGGNLGKPQAIEWLISAISDRRLSEREDIEFYIVGQGSEKEKVVKAAAEIRHLHFMEHMTPEEYDRLMAGMDVGIISLDHRFTIPNFPSRILAYMKAGKPVLACTDAVTDIRELVEDKAVCGLWVRSDDIDGFVGAVCKLSADERLRTEMGRRGFQYLKEHFNVELSVKLLENSNGA